MIVYGNKENFEKEVFETKDTVLVDFYADWCSPCKRQDPVIQSIAEDNALKVVKVSVDENPDIAEAFKLHAIPSVYVMKDGKVTNHKSGYCSRDELLQLLQTAQTEPRETVHS